MINLKKKLFGPEFLIDGKEVFLDAVLIWNEDFPFFYVCVDKSRKYYPILAIDDPEDNSNLVYYVTDVQIDDIFAMLLRKIPICDAFLNRPHFWKITEGKYREDDIVEKFLTTEINKKHIPSSDVFLEMKSINNKRYLKKIRKIIAKGSPKW